MADGVQDTLTYKVDLDTQGLAAQLASVRDVVGRGLSTAAGAAQTGLEVVGGAANRITSDIMVGQQMISAAMPAQMGLSPMGSAGLTLASIPGMPQSFAQEVSAYAGISRAPIGVFPDQYKAVAGQRLNERIQNMGAGALGAAGGVAGSLVGQAIGNMMLPGIGGFIGMFAGQMIGDHAIAPLVNALDGRINERARVQQMFGWNSFRDDERASMATHIRQQSVNSILSPEAFNAIMPAAAASGFFAGMKSGDTAGFRNRFNQAQQFFTEGQFVLQMSGSAEDIARQGQMGRGLRGMGIRDPKGQMAIFNRAHILTQDARFLGEDVTVEETTQQAMEVGAAAQSMGLSSKRAMELHSQQSAVTNRMISEGKLSDEDVGMLGGQRQAGGRMAMATIASQSHPVFKAMALAFSSGVRGGGIDQAAIEAAGGAGRMTFSALADRLSQQLGSADGGAKMISALANPGKLQSDMMANQGAMLRSMTDDYIKQTGQEATEDLRMLVMQKAFGASEVEARAFVRGEEMEAPAKKRMDEESVKLDRDVKGAVATAQTGIAREITQFSRSIKEGFADVMDPLIKGLADQIVPPLEGIRRDLREQRGGGPSQSSKSPISSGSVDFSGHDGTWMIPKDPMSMQGFRSVSESRRFPEPVISMKAESVRMAEIAKLVSLRRGMDTMAG